MAKQTFGSDKTIIKYLLDELPPEDQARFEEAYFGDGSLYEKVRALEEELIEDYVKGDLPSSERILFERHYLASDERCARIEAARQLVDLCSLKAQAQITPDDRIGSWFFSLRERLRSFVEWRPAPFLGIAAVLLSLLATGLAVELLRLRGQLAAVSQEHAAIERRAEESNQQLAHERDLLAEERKRGAGLLEKLESLTSQLAQPERDRTLPPASNGQIVILALAPGGRDIYNPARADISTRTGFVELRGELETQGSAMPLSYRAVVKTDDGTKEIWRQERIKPQRRKSFHYVIVRVPADRLKAAATQDFMLTLHALSADGKNYEEAENYYFQVTTSGR